MKLQFASVTRYTHFQLLTITIGFLVIFLFLLHVGIGKVLLTPYEVFLVLTGQSTDALHWVVVWDLRMPRALIAVLVGAMLGLAGAILQAVLRNPLAEPGIVGVSAGGVLALVFSLGLFPGLFAVRMLLPFIALSGGLLTIGIVYLWSWRGGSDPLRLILTGLLVSSICSSVTTLIMMRSGDALGSILLWTIGSLNARVWTDWYTLWPWALVMVPLGLFCASLANAMHLGDDIAINLGIRAEWARALLFFTAATLTAAAISVVGAIGFIGLIGPHITRRLVGEDARRVFPMSALVSAGLLVLADLIAVSLSLEFPFHEQPIEVALPVGAVTTLLGAPFFLYLLRKRPQAK